MKKQIGIIALALFALAACSEDDVVPAAGQDAVIDGAGGEADTASGDTTADASGADGVEPTDAPVSQDVPPPACTTHEDCDDGIECTGDLCAIDGICSNELAGEICLIEGVCVATGDLNPDNPCEICDSAVVLDAWAARPDAPCDDGNPCTLDDACNKNTCEGTAGPSCCGDGEIEGDETCDGDCPTACDDVDACGTVALEGSADTCDAVCVVTPLTACSSGDGCCPEGCLIADDDDCPELCGNGLHDAGELCDGNCPTSCDEGEACTMAVLEGSPETCDAKCTVSTIEICQGGDGCCPEGCNGMNDGDCPLLCGNKIVEPGELCDGTCPKSCISNNACTPMTVIGSNLTCDSQCVPAETITACLDGDGCCPGGCNESNDNDCDPTQTCAIDIEIQCIDSPWYAALAIISVAAAPGRMTWAYPPNNQPLLNFCTNNNGIPGQFLETSSGCVSATYETGTCVMPELLACEATLCYECP